MGFGRPWKPNRYPYCGCKFEQIKNPDGSIIQGTKRTVKCQKHIGGKP